ncbi:hypothetical protein EBT25_07830 [bacterium]|jgi:hypothetical protein|nr:hypothetical protein [bacterium]
MELETKNFIQVAPATLKIVCPKHGEHSQYITSTIKNHEGFWCMICWLESLGDPLPTIKN